MTTTVLALLTLTTSANAGQSANQVLVEAESFAQPGGWVLDTQFIQTMGSPYLLAHGLGRPVADATTTVDIPGPGTYRVLVRTKDWVAHWNAPGQPGRFQVLVDGKPLAETFGTKGADWLWHDGGTVKITNKQVTIALHDLTGFDGRCDAILLAGESAPTPPTAPKALAEWRRERLGLPAEPMEAGPFDLVVVGGGYSGMGAAISAARMGCKVALVQDRGVLGGNGSSEVRVWANGLIRRGKFPRIGEIVEEFSDEATESPGTADEFGDDHKKAVVGAEKNIKLFLHHYANGIEMAGQRILAVTAFDTRTNARRRFGATLFADCTGHGTIGALAGADFDMESEGRMGMSNMWRWAEAEEPQPFPEVPWALDLDMDDFPYPRDHHGPWFWESGFDKDPIHDAEQIRDWNLRAVFGAFDAMKNGGGAAEHKNAYLEWVAFVGGPRESRRLLGEVILTQEDVVTKRDFPDGCVPSTWSIDLHYPKQQYAAKFPDNPFISVAKFDKRVDRQFGYPVPYRCFYSRNVPNLFMAGRCISVTHEALGTVRVMKTCGMMGEVVGKAAAICSQHRCFPRDVYHSFLDELKELLQLPGQARRETVDAAIQMPKTLLPANPYGPPSGIDPAKLPGLVIDDKQAKLTGKWTSGEGLKGFVGYNYLYASPGSGATARFDFSVPKDGEYEIRLAYRCHRNRASNAPVTVNSPDGIKTLQIDQKTKAPLEHGFISLGVYHLKAGAPAAVVLATEGADGLVHADAVQVLAK